MRSLELGVLACEIFFVTLRLLFLKGNSNYSGDSNYSDDSNYRTIATIVMIATIVITATIEL